MVISVVSFGMSGKNPDKSPSKPKTEDVDTAVSINDNVSTVGKKTGLKISKAELNAVADKIFKNEAGGKKEDIVYWNIGEDFPSLGIGHFIWYRAGQRGKFAESFPQLVAYYRAHDMKLPKIIEENDYSPWANRDELFRLKRIMDNDITELTNFLYDTKDIQVSFIFETRIFSIGRNEALPSFFLFKISIHFFPISLSLTTISRNIPPDKVCTASSNPDGTSIKLTNAPITPSIFSFKICFTL